MENILSITLVQKKTICVGGEAPICVGLWCDAKALDANDSETICVVCGNDADGSTICVAPLYGATQISLPRTQTTNYRRDIRGICVAYSTGCDADGHLKNKKNAVPKHECFSTAFEEKEMRQKLFKKLMRVSNSIKQTY